MKLTEHYEKNKQHIRESLGVGQSFDVIGKDIQVQDKKGYFVFIDGFAKDTMAHFVISRLQDMENNKIEDIQQVLEERISYLEAELFEDIEEMVTMVLSGGAALILEGHAKGLLFDIREYPGRSPGEPELEKVTRGSRDGFVETIILNTALIRRRVRDPRLRFAVKRVGKRSQTDVAIGYIEGLADEGLLDEIHQKIEAVEVESLIMAEKTLEELIIKKKWYNPLPQARFTERPDVTAAHLLEGHIVLIVDTSPSVMILPTTIFHFIQHAEDYYQNPLVGTYIRWIRFLAMFLSLFLIPVWLLLVYNKQALPEFLRFLGPKEVGNIPLFVQFLILEFGLDLLRISSIHTPNSLTTSLGIIGGLILSEFAVKVGFFVPETIIYMAVVGIGTFATPSIEFALAVRMFRLLLLILTGVFRTAGFIAGTLIILIIVCTTKNFSRKSYIWPLFPFERKSLMHILLRQPIPQIRKYKSKK